LSPLAGFETMQWMNLPRTFRLMGVAIASCAFGVGPTSAQPTRDAVPDVSDKALITTQTPGLMATTQVRSVSFSHDEKEILFHSNKTGSSTSTAFRSRAVTRNS
jgi:hypothetical protein